MTIKCGFTVLTIEFIALIFITSPKPLALIATARRGGTEVAEVTDTDTDMKRKKRRKKGNKLEERNTGDKRKEKEGIAK
jgi:NAD/NADP transhydrogenase alpha subunit